MKKIILLTPPFSLKERYNVFALAGSTLPSYGLLTIASFLRKSGHLVKIIEAAALGLSINECLGKIASFQPHFIGIAAVTPAITAASSLAETIKLHIPQTTVIIGGPHVSALPQKTMAAYPAFDVGVIGEGEITCLEIINHYQNNSLKNKKISGIIFRYQNQLITTTTRPFIQHLDDLPLPAWDLLPHFPHRYRPALFKYRQLPAACIITSRGCPNQCTFCDTSIFGNKIRFHSVEYMQKLINFIVNKYRIKEISFEDDTFTCNHTRLKKLCHFLVSSKLKISWSCSARVNTVNNELLKLMRQAGCWQISYGIESGNQQILDSVKKNVTLDQIKTAVKATHQAGILAKGFFIIGFPGENQQTLQDTAHLLKTLPLSDISLFKLTPFPGTQIYNSIKNHGKNKNLAWQHMNLLDTTYIPVQLNKAQLNEFQNKQILKFYLRPKIIFLYLKRMALRPVRLWQLLKIAFLLIFKQLNSRSNWSEGK